jgi:tetratricopeptide (TPR) repeat protein
MFIDPDNPVVRLCAQGMQAEAENRMEDAHALFIQAWEGSTDDYEACIAAHFLARHQEDPHDMLYWNQKALSKAEAVGDERVGGFYPSLYLNMGYSYETLGDLEAAGRYYELAARGLAELPPGPYSEVVRDAVARGRERIRERGAQDE